jgi:Protein of unknown function (DUF4238)
MSLSPEVNHPKNQHYVPQFLLDNFTDLNGKIWVYDKKDDRVFNTSPRNIGAEKYFYDFLNSEGQKQTLENILRTLDSDAAKAIRSILEAQSLKAMSKQQRRTMAQFIAVQQLRVTNPRERARHMAQEFRRVLKDRGFEIDDKFIDDTPEEKKTSDVLNIVHWQDTVKYFYEKWWTLQRAPESSHFYLSDNPVVLFNLIPADAPWKGNLGLNVPYIEIYIPLHKSIALRMLCHQWYIRMKEGIRIAEDTAIRGLGFVDMDPTRKAIAVIEENKLDLLDPENVIHLNSLQVIHSSRYVYSSINDFDLVRDMLAKQPSIRTTPMPTIL